MAEANEVSVHVGSGYRAEISARGHTLVADEPKSLGGTNAGPSPYDYVAAALGSCMAMTIRMYADRRKWPLESVTVRVTHSRVHEKDCERCESEKVGIDQFLRVVELEGELTDEQRAGLQQIAGRCPVGQTLTRGVRIVATAPESLAG